MLGFPKIRCAFPSVPVTRTLICFGPNWGSAILGNYNLPKKEVVPQMLVPLPFAKV